MKKKITGITLALLSVFSLPVSAAGDTTPACTNCFEKRWIYFGGNITASSATTDATFNKLIELIHVAKAEGYNGIAYNAGGSGAYTAMLDPTTPSNYHANFALLVQAAADNGMELIPVGGGPEVPQRAAPDLIEALPVSDTPFIVQGNQARPVGASFITDGGFENNDTAWDLFENASGNVIYDTTVAHTGQRSVKFTKGTGTTVATARLHRKLSDLRAHSAYRLSFWVRSSNYNFPFRLQMTDDAGRPMYLNASARLGWGTAPNGAWNADGNTLAATQDWTHYNLDFNTGNNVGLRLYLGTWSMPAGPNGEVWIDDLDIREIGLAHTIRRTPRSLPVSVKSEDGSITYQEFDSNGQPKDYIVGSESLTLPQVSTIGEGQILKVSAYQSAQNMTAMWGTPASACYQKFFDIQKQYYDHIHALLSGPSKFFLYYDENRVLNWDPACAANITAGKYLADMIKKHQETLLQAYPNLELYVWNDMFDPKMNAVPKYWAVNGDLSNSWAGLKPATVIVNWTDENTAKRKASLEFFHSLGQKQMIAGYYDDHTLGNIASWMQALTQAQANGVSGVNGFMYTTWNGNNGYSDVKAVADYIKQHYPQRWPQ